MELLSTSAPISKLQKNRKISAERRPVSSNWKMSITDILKYANSLGYLGKLLKNQNSEELKTVREAAQKYYNVMSSNKYKFIILEGNNSGIVRRIMQERDSWIELQFMCPQFNFKWQPWSRGIKFQNLSLARKATKDCKNEQMVNHFEFHKEITKKSNLYINMQIFSEVHHLYSNARKTYLHHYQLRSILK